MALPIGPSSTPPPSVRANTGSCIPTRRGEIHHRNKSNVSCPDPSTVSCSPVGLSTVPETRRSVPTLKEEGFAASFQPKYIKPLTHRKLPEPRKPITEIVGEQRISPISSSRATLAAKHKSIEKQKDTSAPKLLTEVAEEDFLRRSHIHKRGSVRHSSIAPESANTRQVSILEEVVEEDQEPFPTPPRTRNRSRNQDSTDGFSLFDLTPLQTRSTSSPEVEDIIAWTGKTKTERKSSALLQLPILKLDTSQRSHANSVQKPSHLSTQHGLVPLINITAQQKPRRKPIGTPPRVKFAITCPTPKESPSSLPSPQNPKRKSIRNNQANTPTKQKKQQQGKSIASLPIAEKYITALSTVASANSEARLIKKLNRQSSLARVRELTPISSGGLYSTSSTGVPPSEPLRQWISGLCHARMPAGPSGPTQTQSQTQSRIDRDRERERERERTALDEAYTAAAAATGNDEDLISGGGSGGTAAGRKNNKGTPSEELSVMIDDMLADLTGRFHAVTSEIMAKMDDMGRRIDNLESSLNQGAEGRKEDEDEEEESKKKGRGD